MLSIVSGFEILVEIMLLTATQEVPNRVINENKNEQKKYQHFHRHLEYEFLVFLLSNFILIT